MESCMTYSLHQTVDYTMADRWMRLRPTAMLGILQNAATTHCDILKAAGLLPQAPELFWAVVRQTVQITRLPQVGEDFTLETWPGKTTKVAFPRHYLAKDKDGNELFRAVALWVLMDKVSRAMVLPGQLEIALEGLQREGELPAPRSFLPKGLAKQEHRVVRYSLLDSNGHMSNIQYTQWVEDLLPAAFHRDHPLRFLQISYIAEALEDQQITLQWDLLEDQQLLVDATREGSDGPERVFAVKASY